MCLIAFAWDYHPKYKLILAANRDEFYERPTRAASFWEDNPDIFGGRDLQALGTWMAISKQGKFGALTNYRDIKNIKSDARSRGEIISDYFNSNSSQEGFIKKLHDYAEGYNGFNFISTDFHSMVHYSNYERKINSISPGIHGLSNALLDTPWPKVDELKTRFEKTIKEDFDHDKLFELLSDTKTHEDKILPNTGVTPELEKALSAICIETEKYGTCSSAILTVDRFGEVNFSEKTLAVGDKEQNTVNFEFKVALT